MEELNGANLPDIVMKELLTTLPQEKRASLLSCLPTDAQMRLERLPKTTFSSKDNFPSCEEALSRIHSSWLQPFIRSLSTSDIELFLASFPKEEGERLAKELRFSRKEHPLSHLAKQFLQKKLLEKVTEESPDLLPFSCLKEDPLNDILSLPFTKLLLLVNFLGLRDLAYEISFITRSGS